MCCWLLAALWGGWLHPASAQDPVPGCGELRPAGQYGPYDYTNPDDREKRLPVVERAHFDAKVQRLDDRDDPWWVVGNVDYTLRAFPNHHPALYAASRYEIQKGGQLPQHFTFRWKRSVECYFKRAIAFKPDDPIVYMLYGIHLHRIGQLDGALEAYKRSEQLLPASSELHYNLGLLHFDRKEYAAAKERARQAYSMGYPLDGLKRKLGTVGQWP